MFVWELIHEQSSGLSLESTSLEKSWTSFKHRPVGRHASNCNYCDASTADSRTICGEILSSLDWAQCKTQNSVSWHETHPHWEINFKFRRVGQRIRANWLWVRHHMPSDSDDRPGKPINLYKFHKPRLHLDARSSALKPETKRSVRSYPSCFPSIKAHSTPPTTCFWRCLRNLANYHTPKVRMKFPRSRCAAVLVALFVGRMGDLYVLLCRYASTTR